jgi:ATP-dependent Clp protease ATP-binding subunit ClpA
MTAWDRDGHGRARPGPWSGLPLAREAAAAHGSTSVGTHHLLLALLSGPHGPAREALHGVGIDRIDVEAAVTAVRGIGPWPVAVTPATLPLSERVEVLLGRAAALRARAPGDGGVRDEDVLVALLESRDRATAQIVLSYLGVDRRTARDLVRRLGAPPEDAGHPEPVG